jgi:hypothetical protein
MGPHLPNTGKIKVKQCAVIAGYGSGLMRMQGIQHMEDKCY